jgi:transposase
VRVEREIRVTADGDWEAVEAAGRRLGWRVYATNTPAAQLALPQAVRAYRREYRSARDRGRLKGTPLSLPPMDGERDDHTTGLIRLLSIGLRGLTLVACGVRRHWAAEKITRAGLSVGNPQRATARPTAERLLAACQGLTLTMIREGRRRRYHLTPLSCMPQRILAILTFPVDRSMRRCVDARNPP